MEPLFSAKDRETSLMQTMLLSRAFEEKIAYLNELKALHGTNHLAIGQEACHTGLIAALDEDDWIIATHRGHGFYLARTGDITGMAEEMYGTKYGMCRGLGGSMHFSDMENHYICSTGIVGGGLPIAAGAAINLKYCGKPGISVACFGDGASNQGMTFETMNLASMMGLRLLFFCENNQYAVSSPSSEFIANTTLVKRAAGFGIASFSVDGNDITAVTKAVIEAKEYILRENRPYFLEAVTYRMSGHSRSDKLVYRTEEEEAAWMEKDPIKLYKKVLMDDGALTEEAFMEMKKSAEDMVEDAFRVAESHKDEHADITDIMELYGG
ncbi:MAG: thiamine pyrophosphate-dependent dehydrogenase E1 component subunit alpha [Eubacteriales bacterium]|nr:thiamine pyrophosphate-dependent dehydrogenase E1 component subunit alpha [Eubacteriales bacterium]